MMTVLSRWKIGIYLAAIFAAGGISGYFVAGKVKQQQAIDAKDGKQITKEIALTFRDRCHARLNMTPEQAKKVDAIIDKFSAKMNAAFEDSRACIRRIRDERNKLILGELGPDQKAAFEQMEKEKNRKEASHGKEPVRSKSPGSERGDRGDRGDRDRADCATNLGGISNILGVTGALQNGLETQKQ